VAQTWIKIERTRGLDFVQGVGEAATPNPGDFGSTAEDFLPCSVCLEHDLRWETPLPGGSGASVGQGAGPR
jgi:hypothetical protein